MRHLLPILATALLLASCATAPIPTTSAGVKLDACGHPVVTVTVEDLPAGPEPWRASTTTTVYQPCPEEAPDAPAPTPAR